MEKGFSKVPRVMRVLLIITSLVLISYSGNAATAAPKNTAVKTATSKMTPKYGGTLIVRNNIPVVLGYPAKLSGAEVGMSYICTDTLIHFSENGKPIPWLATAWNYSSSLNALTLSLRKGVKFHDGTDFNAAAVKTNLDLCIAAKRAELAAVSSVEVIDTHIVRLNLSRVDAFLIPNLAESVGVMISPAALAKGEDFCRTNPVGTGPFKQVDYKSGVSVKYEKWDGYWQKGKPYLDAVQVLQIPNDTTAASSFKKGEINMLSLQDAVIIKDLKDAGAIVGGAVSGHSALIFDSGHKNSPFADIKVRQAIAYAIDINTIQKSFGVSYFQSSNQFVDKSTPYYNPKIAGYPYNVQKAKAVLATTSYPKGFNANIIYINYPINELVCTAVQSMLAKIGINLTLQPMGGAAYNQLRIDGWQNGIILDGLSIVPECEPGRYLQSNLSKNSLRYSSSLVAKSDEFDTLLSLISAEPDFNKRIPLNQRLLKQMVDGECMIDYVFNFGRVHLKSPKLKDENKSMQYQWTPQDAWFSE
jgi:peptide/nickel transport system substrate-binding protein